jgi:ADP-ribose pyrophosphatase YjhB (NUDIX family)
LTGLNPLLEQTRHCPRCGAAPEVRLPRSLHCPSCGLRAYFNPKPVACVIARDAAGGVVLVRRAHEPGAGRWSMPGGFVDLGESVEDAARREVREELEADVELGGLVGVYSSGEDRVVVIVYAARLDGEPRTTDEVTEVRAFAPDDLPWAELAFTSDELALRDVLR